LRTSREQQAFIGYAALHNLFFGMAGALVLGSSRSGRKSLTRLAKTGIFQEWGGDFWAAVSQDDFRFRGAARLAPTEEGTLARLKACRERGINPSE
jgi:hypothetical protein